MNRVLVDDPSNEFDEVLAEAVHEPPLLVPGTRLVGGRFVVGSLLSTGGVGAVYRATDARRDRDVAIKMLLRVEPAGIYSLKQEFRSLCSIRHPNLVVLHELFFDRGSWFFTMDLVDGRPVSQVTWNVPLVRDVFGQIANAIHAIHCHGKLHRDLKPANVMLTPAGRVVVLDFGLVCDEEPGGPGRTLVNEGLAGTPAYMAPELATDQANRGSDWYAFGTMLYEALSGKLPFSDPGLAALMRKREEPAPPPAVHRGVPKNLLDLCLRLLDRDTARRPGHDEIIAELGLPSPASVPPQNLAEDPFVGREAELQVLEQALLATDGGHAAAVTVSGAPGIGKTKLVRTFLEGARHRYGAITITGQCPRWEHVPFRACDSMVDHLCRHLRTLPAERAAAVLPRSTHVLTRLFPVLERLPVARAFKPPRRLPHDASEVRRLGLAALRDLLGNIAAQDRLVVFVDDMQWSDREGARFLASLATRGSDPGAPPLLLVVAYRTEDAEDAPGLAAFLERLRSPKEIVVEDLRLGELSATESQHLTRELFDGPRDAIEARIVSEAGGNPLFIRQLARLALESSITDAPLDLPGTLAQRIATFPPSERQALDAICLTSRPVSVALLSRVIEQPDAEHLVRNLVLAQLARFTSGFFDQVSAFHDRIREVVVSRLDAAERRELHARFVRILEQADEPDLAALTLHYVGCGREGDAAVSAVAAAERSVAVMAFEQAAAMYRLALGHGRWTEQERRDLLLRAGEALVLGHRCGEAGSHFVEAASLATDPAERQALRLRAAEQFLAGGWLPEGIGLLREILAEVGLDYDAIGRSDLMELRQRLAQRHLRVERRRPPELSQLSRARLDALRVAGNGLAWLKPESVPFRFMLALEALDAGEPLYLANGLRTVARFDAQFDPASDEVHRLVLELCDENPGPEADLIRSGLESARAFVTGRPWDLFAAARRSEELLLGSSTQDARVLDVARYHQAVALFIQSELSGLQRCWGWLEDAEHRNDVFLGSWLNALLGVQYLAHDRPEGAREMCRKAAQTWAAVETMQASAMSLAQSDVLSACDVYEGDGSAWNNLRTGTAWFAGSALGIMPFMVCHYHGVRARTALACAQSMRSTDSQRERLLCEAEVSIAAAAAARGRDGRVFVLPHYRNLALLLAAGLAAARGDRNAALVGLEQGLEQLDAVTNYSLLSAHARRARGTLIGGREGSALVEQAEADLELHGVVDPRRHARTILPGFPA